MKFLNQSHLSQVNHAPQSLYWENLISLITPTSLDNLFSLNIQVNRTILGNLVSRDNPIYLDIQVNPVNQISQTKQVGHQNRPESLITQISTQVKQINLIRKVQLRSIQSDHNSQQSLRHPTNVHLRVSIRLMGTAVNFTDVSIMGLVLLNTTLAVALGLFLTKK